MLDERLAIIQHPPFVMEGDICIADLMLIGGERVASVSDELFDVPDPATEEVIGQARRARGS
jgi:hypothetical protein